MRKVISLFTVLFVLICSTSFGELTKTYVIQNDSETTELTTYVSTSTIIPGIHRILGFTVHPVGKSNLGVYAAIYDATTNAHRINTNLKGESEVSNNESADKFLPYPVVLSRGLGVTQAPKTVVIIEYTR